MTTTLSLERIDEYMRQLKAVTDYDRVCEELEKVRQNFAKRGQTLYFCESLTDRLVSKMDKMQTELKEKEDRLSLCYVIIKDQRKIIALLQGASNKPERNTAKKVQDVGRDFNSLKNFVSLGVIVDDWKTILTRRKNAICYWLLTNGLLRI